MKPVILEEPCGHISFTFKGELFRFHFDEGVDVRDSKIVKYLKSVLKAEKKKDPALDPKKLRKIIADKEVPL